MGIWGFGVAFCLKVLSFDYSYLDYVCCLENEDEDEGRLI